MPSRASEPAERCQILWNERIARATALAGERPAAAALLTFYAALAEYQKSLIDGSQPDAFGAAGDGPSTASFRDALDLEPGLRAIPQFLTWLSPNAPAPLAEAATELRHLDRAEWQQAMQSHLRDDEHHAEGVNPTVLFVVGTVLQPFAERLALQRRAEHAEEMPLSAETRTQRADCLMCGGRPVLGVLREEGQGAKRTLLCALCLTERDYLRVVCPGCGEQKFDALPVYTAEQFGHIRIEACDSCRTYLKTIDLTKDGLAVPMVDDIASVSMDLWARERGYERQRPNVLMI